MSLEEPISYVYDEMQASLLLQKAWTIYFKKGGANGILNLSQTADAIPT